MVWRKLQTNWTEVLKKLHRADEIERLTKAINHITARLSAFVKGQNQTDDLLATFTVLLPKVLT